MMNSTFRWLSALSLALVLGACADKAPPAAAHGDHQSLVAGEFERGPHRGRLLRKDGFALEITIFETGVPPQFRLYAYQDDQPLPASEISAAVELGRLGDITDSFRFTAESDYLVGDGTVVEPHSFDVVVAAKHRGQRLSLELTSPTKAAPSMPAAIAEAAGVTIAQAGAAVIRDEVALMGQVALNADRYAASACPLPRSGAEGAGQPRRQRTRRTDTRHRRERRHPRQLCRDGTDRRRRARTSYQCRRCRRQRTLVRDRRSVHVVAGTARIR